MEECQKKPNLAKLTQTVKSYWKLWDSVILVEGLLKRVIEGEDGSQRRLQLLAPRKRILNVQRLVHDTVSGKHKGVNRILERVRQRFY